MNLVPVAVFDLDGTIRYSKSGKFISGPDDIALFDDVESKLWKLRNQGYHIIGVSNQGGVAYGFKSRRQAEDEITATRRLFMHDPFHLMFFCPYHEDGTIEPYCHRSLLRKPFYGMLAVAEYVLAQAAIHPDWDNSFVVGDRDEDCVMAVSANVDYFHANWYFEREKSEGARPAQTG